MKIYIVKGCHPYEACDDYGTHTEICHSILQAYTNRKMAVDRVQSLKKAVSLWNKALVKPEVRKGIRGEIFLIELQKKMGDRCLSEESEYSIIEVELKE